MPPPRTTIGVADLLVRDALIEIDLIATLPSVKKQAIDRRGSSKLTAMLESALIAGGLIFVEGLSSASIDPDPKLKKTVSATAGGSFASIKEETRFLLGNLMVSFENIGISLRNTVKAQVFLLDPADLLGFEEAWGEYFSIETPRTVIQAAALRSDGARLEIDLIAEI